MTLRTVDGYGVSSAELQIADRGCDLSRFDASLEVTPDGSLIAVTRGGDERALGVLAVEQTLITVCDPSNEQGGTALGAPGNSAEAYAAQVAATGAGTLLITDRRLLGVVCRSVAEDAEPMIDRDGNGHIFVFSVDREVFDRIDIERGGLRKKVREICLRGPGNVSVQLFRAIKPDDLIGREDASGPMRSASRLTVTPLMVLDDQKVFQKRDAPDAAASLLDAFVR